MSKSISNLGGIFGVWGHEYRFGDVATRQGDLVTCAFGGGALGCSFFEDLSPHVWAVLYSSQSLWFCKGVYSNGNFLSDEFTGEVLSGNFVRSILVDFFLFLTQ